MNIWLFDIDGTLIRTNGVGQRSMEMAIESAFGIESDFDDVRFSGRTDYAITTDIFRMKDVSDTPSNRQKFHDEYLKFLERNLKTCTGQVLPGVLDLLNILANQANVRLGLLTGNIEQAAVFKLKHFELHHFFEFGGFGNHDRDRNDVAKRAYKAACESLETEVSRNKVWVIGDTPADIQCGESIGANTIAVATGSFPADQMASYRPNHLVQNLTELDHRSLVIDRN